MDELLTFTDIDFGVQEGTLNLRLLYPDAGDRRRFENKCCEFLSSDPSSACLFCRKEHDLLVYRTESFIPTVTDARPPVMLLLGNPATHSVLSGLCFAYERKHQEHRFWRGLWETGLLVFRVDATYSRLS